MKMKLRSGHTVRLDDEDFTRIANWGICAVKKRHVTYAELYQWDKANQRQIKVMLHRFVMLGLAPSKFMVCHLNGNGLDCRKANLEFGTHRSNGSSHRTKRAGAASKYRGVHINRGRGKRWTAQFWDGGRNIYIGRFDSQRAAARAYDKEAAQRFGRFAQLNFK